ncbi:MAG: hypothetical protein QGG17_04500 [Rhodospirillales bacterium]|jgi:glycerophosphoryl diester phosphodiesterase|nr:hypothetical protein [Rhodospirillales bacterium]MDP6804292.1 hypothetical protein [Rhodospirillales bacterium]
MTTGTDAQPLGLELDGLAVRLKWHQLRRRAADPPYSRRNLAIGLAAGACLEVDIRRLACGRFVCLHDPNLESETTGRGPVADVDAEAIRKFEMRGGGAPLLLDELAGLTRAAGNHPSPRVQLDLMAAGKREIDGDVANAFAAALAGLGPRFILSGENWEAVSRLGTGVEGLALGYDPTGDAGVDADAERVERLVRAVAPDAHTLYLHRDCVRASQTRGEGLVRRLKARGHRIDCWTIDLGEGDAVRDLRAAITAGCDAITANTAIGWAAWSPGGEDGGSAGVPRSA